MSDEANQGPSASSNIRRSSFAGQTFADLFGNGRPSMNRNPSDANPSPPTQSLPGPISQAAAQAQRRRLSLTTLGLSASPNQSSPFGSSVRVRGESFGSSSAGGSIDESAIAEDEATRDPNNTSHSPSNTPFQRRTSFGAKALREIRAGSFSGPQAGGGGGGGGGAGSPGTNGNKAPSSNGTAAANQSSSSSTSQGTISSRDAKGRGVNEGFNWSDNLRTRAERTSIGQGSLGNNPAAPTHTRSKSIATMEPPPVAPPKPKERPRPDHFQERILKGDFYMD